MNPRDTLGTPDELAFLKRIAESPADDLPRLVFADWIEERDSPTDLGLATASYIRLSCGVPAKGEGSRKAAKLARGWLLGNWRRLVPSLMVEFDQHPSKAQVEQDAAEAWDRFNRATANRLNAIPFLVAATLAEDRAGVWERWKNGVLSAGIPFTLATRDPDLPTRTYICRVNMRFDRGFLAWANWMAPNLGPRIAERLRRDQPLAKLSGPGA